MSTDPSPDVPGVPQGSVRDWRSDLPRLVATATPALQKVAARMMGASLRKRCRTSDLVQSALVEAIASMPLFRGKNEDEFVGWTLRIMEHNALDRQRRQMAEKRQVDREVSADQVGLHDLAGTEPSPSQVAVDREELVLIAKSMQSLSDNHRRILEIVALRGGTHAEAARTLGKSEQTCRVMLNRARAALLVEMAKLRHREQT